VTRGKIHLHSEQFDGYLHAACGRADESARILTDDAFASAPPAERCAYCSREYWPHGEWPHGEYR
jgi:hypothetical protein